VESVANFYGHDAQKDAIFATGRLTYATLKLQINKTTFLFVCLLQRSDFFIVFRCHVINETVTDRYISLVTERD